MKRILGQFLVVVAGLSLASALVTAPASADPDDSRFGASPQCSMNEDAKAAWLEIRGDTAQGLYNSLPAGRANQKRCIPGLCCVAGENKEVTCAIKFVESKDGKIRTLKGQVVEAAAAAALPSAQPTQKAGEPSVE